MRRYMICCQEHGWIDTTLDLDHAIEVRLRHRIEQHGEDWDGEILIGQEVA